MPLKIEKVGVLSISDILVVRKEAKMAFRKKKKILPGVNLNISNKGVGVSVGAKGARMGLNSRGTYVSGSIPSTGISKTKYLNKEKGGNSSDQSVTVLNPLSELESQIAENRKLSYKKIRTVYPELTENLPKPKTGFRVLSYFLFFFGLVNLRAETRPVGFGAILCVLN